ncbi:MAG TPA: hypothetical protein VFV91_09170, partial [Gaiellaceae bacterium]|nr:hypothetical protein [Gaiellaceae bacterium]
METDADEVHRHAGDGGDLTRRQLLPRCEEEDFALRLREPRQRVAQGGRSVRLDWRDRFPQLAGETLDGGVLQVLPACAAAEDVARDAEQPQPRLVSRRELVELPP